MDELTSRQHLALAERLAAAKHWGQAEQHYIEALNGDDAHVSAAAALRLGRHAEHVNDWQAAHNLYGKAMEQGDEQVRTRAAFFLGALHLVEGDNARARDMLVIATESAEQLIRPYALVRLGDACYRLDDFIGAYHAYNAAHASGNDQVKRWATAQLHYVEAHIRRIDAARQASGSGA